MFADPPGSPIEILFDPDLQDEAAAISAQEQRELGLPAEYGEVGVQYEDPYLKVVKDAVRFPSGRLGTYVRTCAAVDGEAVVAVATAGDGRIVLVRHFRHGCREWHWEFPRGFAEAGRDGPENVVKEVEEELGIVPRRVTLLGWLDEQQSDRKVGVYHTTVELTDPDGVTGDAAEEGIDEVRLVSPGQLRSMIRGQEISDMYTLGAFALAVATGLVAVS